VELGTDGDERSVIDAGGLHRQPRRGRGIGRASAQALAEAGARVLVHYGRAGDEAHSLVTEIGNGGGQAKALFRRFGTAAQRCGFGEACREAVGEHLDVPMANAGQIRFVRRDVVRPAAREGSELSPYRKSWLKRLR
jgi:NAD(P)-dependent dehydrogenase (short-subunit alcohol dehydrogenase family)